eukprot:IDg16171t1
MVKPRESTSIRNSLLPCLFYGCTSVSITFFNKAVFSVYKFNFPGILTLFQILFCISALSVAHAAEWYASSHRASTRNRAQQRADDATATATTVTATTAPRPGRTALPLHPDVFHASQIHGAVRASRRDNTAVTPRKAADLAISRRDALRRSTCRRDRPCN